MGDFYLSGWQSRIGSWELDDWGCRRSHGCGDRMTSLGKKDYSYADGNDALLCEMGNRQDTYRNIDIIKVVARSW